MMRYEQLIRNTFTVVSEHGDEFLCKCPYHDDTGRPNLYANAVKGVFLCHACGAKGRLESRELPEDWEGLLKRMDMKLEPPPPTFYNNTWLDQFDNPCDYWRSRGFSDQTIRQWKLGYDIMRNEGTIPVWDERSRLIGAIRRRFAKDGPKYLYPKGFPLSRILFGSHRLGKNHRKAAIVEGSLDTIACWNARVPALGLLGAHITETQHQLLHKMDVHHIVLMTDNDVAGDAAVESVLDTVKGITVSVAQYRSYWNAKDPGDLQPQQIRKMFHSALRSNMRT